MRGNIATTQPAPLVVPRKGAKALNEEAADAIGERQTSAEEADDVAQMVGRCCACRDYTAGACSEKAAEAPAAAPAPEVAATPAAAAFHRRAPRRRLQEIDPAHASLVFTVNHLGFSHYTAQFTRYG